MLNQMNKPIFRICSDTLFKEVFTKVPNALINLVNDCLDIDYENFKDNILKQDISTPLSSKISNIFIGFGRTFSNYIVENKKYVFLSISKKSNGI